MEDKKIVIKSSGKQENFDPKKIEKAILRAMRTGSGIYKKKLAELIASEAAEKFEKKAGDIKTSEIDDYIRKSLVNYGQSLTAQAYEKYKTLKIYRQQDNEIVDSVMGIVNQTDEELINENANKNFRAFSTQRDLSAGEVSKLIARHILPEELLLAHQEGIIHIHDLDYFGGFEDKNGSSPLMWNCCLVNLKDMLDNGTVINNKLISGINSFNKACTVASQIALTVSSGQYGGQTMSVAHLAPYVRKARERWKGIIGEDKTLTEEQVNAAAERLLKKEISDGVKTLNYQLNTFVSSNGQTPFISLFMYINEDPEYVEETATIIEEILKQRIAGMKNRKGYTVIQTFPKLLYVLEECNLPGGGGKYEYLSNLAAECVSKTMCPDFISAKIMHERFAEYDKDGNEIHNGVFPCMGCRSFPTKWIDPETGKPKYYGRFNKGVQSINLPDVALSSGGDFDVFWQILDERLELIHRVGEGRVANFIKNADNIEGSPIHWKYGAIARLKDGDSALKYIDSPYATISLGFIGIHEMCMAMFGKSHTETPEASEFAMKVVQHMKDKTVEWNEQHNIGWSLYSTPSEGYCETSWKKTLKRFGEVPGVTDHGFFTNSYHYFVGTDVDVFTKFEYEAEYQNLCSGGCISYAEIGNLEGNLDVIKEIMRHIYEHIRYAELNTECDRCNSCGSTAPLKQDENDNFFCPECGSYDVEAVRRICGYLGVASNGINKSKRHEMSLRIKHI